MMLGVQTFTIYRGIARSAKSLILDVAATPDVPTMSPVGGKNQCILGYLEVPSNWCLRWQHVALAVGIVSSITNRPLYGLLLLALEKT